MIAALTAALVVALGACGTLDTGLAAGRASHEPLAPAALTPAAALIRERDCCASLRELPFQPLDRAGTLAVEIGARSPVHAFDSGLSRFAAFRIDRLPRPVRIEVRSLRTAEAGSWLQLALPQTRQRVFQPIVLVLDQDFRVVRRLDAGQARPGCREDPDEPAYSLPVLIDEPPGEAAWLVLATSTEALVREGASVCGVLRHGMSPVGRLELRTRLLPPVDRPLRMALPVTWYSGARSPAETGIWQSLVAEPGLVVLGQQRLHMLLPDGPGYRQVLELAYADLVRAGPGTPGGATARSFYVSALEPPSGRDPRPAMHDHLFDIGFATSDGVPPVETVVAMLRSQIGAGIRVRQTVAWQVRAELPATAIQGGFLSRLSDAATTGGLIAAMPCGACQAGVCPPSALGGCAVLFGIGAVLGGTTGLVGEVVHGAPAGDAGRTPIEAQATGGMALAPSHLELCLHNEFEQPGRGIWTDTGLSVRSALAAPPGAPPDPVADYRAEVRLRELVMELVGKASDGSGEPLWRLHLRSDLTFTTAATGHHESRTIDWMSQPKAESAWLRPDSALMPAVTAEACTAVAAGMVEAGEAIWRGR